MEIKFKTAERLSHAYIISALDMADAVEAAKEIAAAAVCKSAYDIPCGQCPACRKAHNWVHPDITMIELLEGKKEISVDQIREMAADAYVLPNEAERKVYIIKNADAMNDNAQNAALKIFEEPPKGVIFILCVINPAGLLTTVRSRCVELKLGGEAAAVDEATMKLAEEFIKLVSKSDRAGLMKFTSLTCEKLTSKELNAFCDCVLDICADLFTRRRKVPAMSNAQLYHISELIKTCSKYMTVNVGVKHILGLLAVNAIMSGSRGNTN